MYAMCADICLPLQASFELALNPKPDMRGTFLVERAMRSVPRDAPPSALGDGVWVTAADGGAAMDIHVPKAGADPKLIDVFAEGPSGWHLPPVRPIASKEDVKVFRLDLAGLPEGKRGTDAAMRLTVVHPAGAFEQTVDLPKAVPSTD
jgi:DsbC/DsbD-like thiol-disulfide interchange protein